MLSAYMNTFNGFPLHKSTLEQAFYKQHASSAGGKKKSIIHVMLSEYKCAVKARRIYMLYDH